MDKKELVAYLEKIDQPLQHPSSLWPGFTLAREPRITKTGHRALEGQAMTPREKLQLSYEITFFPPRLNELWARIRAGTIENNEETAELLDTALLLHQALPESGYPSQRALARLAQYQAHTSGSTGTSSP